MIIKGQGQQTFELGVREGTSTVGGELNKVENVKVIRRVL